MAASTTARPVTVGSLLPIKAPQAEEEGQEDTAPHERQQDDGQRLGERENSQE
jgi:hypothetical protein